jgi:Predicted Rossmann fold nucleotide-binding protein
MFFIFSLLSLYMQIAIAAHGSETGEEVEDKSKRFLRVLSRCHRHSLLVGGYWGLMRTVVDEALRLGINVVAILPEEMEHVILPPQVVRINTGCEPRCRSVMLVRSGDVLVSLGGEAGTMTEILMAYAMGKTIYSLVGTGLSTDLLLKAFPTHLDQRRTGEVFHFQDPEEMGREICKKYYGI